MKILFTLLLFIPIFAFGQVPLTDMSLLPAAPTLLCIKCDATNMSDSEIKNLFRQAVILNYKSCVHTKENLFHEKASAKNCNRGAFFILGSHENKAYYIHFSSNGIDVTVVLLFYLYRPNDFTNCNQMIVCRYQKDTRFFNNVDN